jgi:hypothetical protein
MSYSPEAAQQIAHDLLSKAEVLAVYLRGLGATDPAHAKAVFSEVVARLEQAVSSETDLESKSDRPASQRAQLRVASRSSGGDDTEEFILENLASTPNALSVQQIVDRFEEAQIEMKRATLVVRLHRMVQAGKLTSPTHAHYVLSDAEKSRRRSA